MTSQSKLRFDNLGKAGLTVASISAAFSITQAFINANSDTDRKTKQPVADPASPTAPEPPAGQSLPTVQEGDEGTLTAQVAAKPKGPRSPSTFKILQTLGAILREGKFPISPLVSSVALTVIARAVGELFIHRITSELDEAVSRKNRDGFSKFLTLILLISVPVATFQQLSYFSASNLSSTIRQSLTDLLMKRLVLSPHNLCHPEELVDQERLEALLGDVSQAASLSVQLAGDRLKRTTEVLLQAGFLTKTLGFSRLAIILTYLVGTVWISARQKQWKSFFSRRVAERETAFKKILARIQRHRDDVALWNGAAAEQIVVEKLIGKIEAARRTRDTFEFLHGLSGILSGRVGGTALGMFLIATQWFKEESRNNSLAQLLLTGRVMVQFCGSVSSLLEDELIGKFVNGEDATGRLASSVRRLKASLIDLPKQLPPADALPFRIRKSNLCLNDVTGMSPDGSVLFQSLSLELSPGGALLIHGPQRSGKSALLRLMAGTWPAVMGEVSRPKSGVLCVPAKPYLILEGSLKDQVCYPDSGASIDADRLQTAIQVCKISHLFTTTGIGRSGSGSALMGDVDQQKLMLARLVYHRPRYALLDDCWNKLETDYFVGVLRYLQSDLQCGVVLATCNADTLKTAYPFDLELVMSNGKQPPRHEIIVHQQARSS